MTHGGRWKMRYAAHLGLLAPDAPMFRHSARSAAVEDQVAYLADLGFAGVQDNFLKLRSVEEQTRLGRAAARHGLELGSFNNNPSTWDRPVWSSTDPAALRQLEHDLLESIDVASRTGARQAVCVAGRDPERSKAEQIATMAENLARLADTAARADLVLHVEPVTSARFPQLLVNGLEDALTIVGRVDHPAVRLQFDVAHVEEQDGSAFEHLQRCWPLVGLVQAADVPGRVDLGAGTLDWPSMLRWIRAQGYRGLIEIEHLPLEDSAAGEQRLLERLRAVDAAI
jgi:hydroxypyruvate isomerase